MSYQYIIFDFDGTLADSLALSVAIVNRLAPRFRLTPVADLETARSMPTKKLLRQMGVRFWKLPRLVKAFQAEAAVEADGMRLFPGVAAAIAELAARGHVLGVLSSNRADTIRRCLRANGVEDYFAFVVGYPKLFGKAKALRRIRRAYRVSRSDMLYVGDEMRDVQAARRARIAVAAVTWGFQTELLLAAARPTYLVHTPGELVAISEACPVGT